MPESVGSRLEPFAELGLTSDHEVFAPLVVEPAHAAEMGREVAFLDEIGESRLQDSRRVLPGQKHRLRDVRDHVQRQNDIAHAQGREHGFGKGADIDGSAVRRHALQRRHGVPGKAVFAVEVVFDDPGVVSARDLRQAQPLFEAHRNAERTLA